MAINARRYEPWTDEDILALGRLVEAGLTSRRIAELIGRTEGTVNQARQRFGFVKRPEACVRCGNAIVPPPREGPQGRPRRYCTVVCRELANAERKAAAINAKRDQAIAERTDWTCRHCGTPLERDDPRRIFCSNACAKRVWYLRKRDARMKRLAAEYPSGQG